MEHKFRDKSGKLTIPSVAWLRKAMRRYVGQRLRFHTVDKFWSRMMVEAGFDPQKVVINGIFNTVWKYPKAGGVPRSFYSYWDTDVVLEFRDCLFQCDGKSWLPLCLTRTVNKKRPMTFKAAEIYAVEGSDLFLINMGLLGVNQHPLLRLGATKAAADIE